MIYRCPSPFLKQLSSVALTLSLSLAFLPSINAQDKPAPEKTEGEEEEEQTADSSTASLTTLKNARTMNFTIPAPRGMIMDRNGVVLAQNKVWYEISILFGQQPDESPEALIAWAEERIDAAIKLTGKKQWKLTEEDHPKILDHYKNRRWLPYTLPGLFNDRQRYLFSQSSIMKKTRGLVLHGQYLRYYPQKSSAAHIVGYVRSIDGKKPTGPISDGESIFLETKGAEGLEQTMNDILKGTKGVRKLRVDSEGRTIVDETTPPKAGSTIATTINVRWQQTAESVLRGGARRGGAFAVVDCHSGEILALASQPTYDINKWIPRISTEDYAEIRDNKYKPLFARAFQAQYPPASSFKPIVAATALTAGTIGEHTKIDCPAFLRIAERKLKNHSKTPAGKIDVKYATARSNNVFFAKVGIMLGPEPFLSMARRMGFGSRTTNELFNEKPGFVPSNEWSIQEIGRKLTQGQTANFAIGQGEISATPLQVAQGMAALGNGKILPRLHIIKQIQDINGRVLRASQPEIRNELGLDAYAVKVARKGMHQVVYASYGTGKQGAPSYSNIAGKTGTAEWYGNRRLAWFAGVIPHHNPRYAFACVYEGGVGERPSGGKYAAPIVRRFLNSGNVRYEIQKGIRPAAKAKIVEGTTIDDDKQAEEVLQAIPLGNDDL